MTRKEFLKICGILGVGIPFNTSLSSCNDESVDPNTIGKVLIIGAGAGGLSSGHLLQQLGIDFEILEASSTYGGRMKRTLDFADFPIPLGAEWLHIERGIFEEAVNDTNVQVNVATTLYNPAIDTALWDGEQITIAEADFTEDQKFINSTWFDFYEEYIVPSVNDKITYNAIVESIDYTGEQITVNTQTEVYTADKVIFAAPVKMLQNGAITFTPALPADKQKAINEVRIWDGCKAFIEFSEKFYPAIVGFTITPETDGQKLYYDAAYGQNTNQNILGLFAVGTAAQTFNQADEEDRINRMLAELDEVFENQATPHYIKHTFQNWNAEPFINGAYVNDHEDWRKVRTLGASIDNKLFFAGTSYTEGDDWGSVHTAARSAKRAIDELIS